MIRKKRYAVLPLHSRFVFLQAAVLLWIFGLCSTAQATEGCRDQSERTSSDGHRYIAIRWPLGSQDHIVNLVVPQEYLPLVSLICELPLVPGYKEPDTGLGYRKAFGLEASLPDFAPQNADNKDAFVRGLNWFAVSVLLSAVLNDTDDNAANIEGYRIKNLKSFEIYRQLFLNKDGYLLKAGGFDVSQKSDYLGLKRIGVTGDAEQFHHAWGGGEMNDLLSPSDGPAELWFSCQSFEIKDVSEDPSWKRRPPCTIRFITLACTPQLRRCFRGSI